MGNPLLFSLPFGEGRDGDGFGVGPEVHVAQSHTSLTPARCASRSPSPRSGAREDQWTRPGSTRRYLLTALWCISCTAHAQSPPPDARTLDTVEVVARAQSLSRFPGSVDVIDGATLRDGQRQVNLSESLQRVPGVSVLDRQNYAQDLQVQSRGFGARSTFGIRGLKLVVDGIPASAADGQGQAATFPLGALDRIEVLRGPLALQYGNAAGGAIVGYTDLDQPAGASLEAWGGSHGSGRIGARVDGNTAGGDWRWRAHGSHFRTDGAREHSAAERSQFDFVGEWAPRDGDRVRFVLNSLAQPYTEDPLGLTRDALRANPHGTDPVALLFDTRKRIDNHQAGVRWERETSDARSFWLGAYRIERGIVQFLSVPPVAQAAPTSAGGVIDLARGSTGIDAGHRREWTRGALALGIEAVRLDETRRGYENFVGDASSGPVLGVRGRLRRDERNRVDSRELHAIGDVALADAWTLLGAVRHARLEFASDDRYFASGNGDDSGQLDYRETAASLGVAHAFDGGEVFASVGRGFETPTVTELAYRPDGTPGFNRDLQPARTTSAEAGVRWRWTDGGASATAYRVDGEDEIVPAESRGGRASFANAGRTRREGIELGVSGRIGGRWSYALAANAIRAKFTESYSFRVASGGQSEVRTVAAGSRIPGVPRADGFAELGWRSRDARWLVAAEARASGAIAVDDRNSDETEGYVLLALRAEWKPRPRWHALVRVDNVFDREYVGSVIVNEGNGRYFEPGTGRSVTVGFGYGR